MVISLSVLTMLSCYLTELYQMATAALRMKDGTGRMNNTRHMVRQEIIRMVPVSSLWTFTVITIIHWVLILS